METSLLLLFHLELDAFGAFDVELDAFDAYLFEELDAIF